MAKAKKKLLPKDFEALLDSGDIEALKSVFATCDVNARGGYSKQTALAFAKCPDELARWLVDQGADISADDKYGETPLHARAGHWQGQINILLELGADVHRRDNKGNTPLHQAAAVGNIHTARTLLKHGARVDAVNKDQLTPLALALQLCSNAKIQEITAVAELLLDAQPRQQTGIRALASRFFGGQQKRSDQTSPEMWDFVQRIGQNFEFHRSGFNPESRDATSAALKKLYTLFNVPPVPCRVVHDGKSPIVAKAANWEDRHLELWEMLVPSSGPAETVQGEVIRISGRINDEIHRNGGANWRPDFKKMADAFLRHIGSGVALSEPVLAEAAALVAEIKRGGGDTGQLCELAINWVVLNPEPERLPKPDYRI